MLLIALSLSEGEGRGGGWRDNVKAVGVIGKGMRAERGREIEEAEHTAQH